MQYMNASQIKVQIGDRSLAECKALSVYKGDKIGLIGDNGAGKTQLLHYLTNADNVKWNASYAMLNQLHLYQAPISGGQKTKEQLDEVFRQQAEVLLLDEPTNNLDWESVDILEAKLMKTEKAMIVVKHDRELLNKVCSQIWEIRNGKIYVYRMSFSQYKEQRKNEIKLQESNYYAYQQEKRRRESLIQQKTEQASQMKKAPSRMGNSEARLHKRSTAGRRAKIERVSEVNQRKLAKLEAPEKPIALPEITMRMGADPKVHRSEILFAKNLEYYVHKQLLYQIKYLTLAAGSKTALIGGNGAGKSTLLRQLLVHDEKIDKSKQARIGVFHQELETLPAGTVLVDYITEHSDLSAETIRAILARLGFKRDTVYKKIGVLSGGERVKAALARLFAGSYNVLFLDEPTNHLDLQAMQALEALIRDYEGTILYVSHDRSFVNHTATHIFHLKDKQLFMFEGDLSCYFHHNNEAPNDTEQELMQLNMRITEIISKLSLTADEDEKQMLENTCQQLLSRRKKFIE